MLENNPEESSPLLQLHPEISRRIFSGLQDINDIVHTELVCKTFYSLVKINCWPQINKITILLISDPYVDDAFPLFKLLSCHVNDLEFCPPAFNDCSLLTKFDRNDPFFLHFRYLLKRAQCATDLSLEFIKPLCGPLTPHHLPPLPGSIPLYSVKPVVCLLRYIISLVRENKAQNFTKIHLSGYFLFMPNLYPFLVDEMHYLMEISLGA